MVIGPIMGTALVTLDCSSSAAGKSEAIAERVLKNMFRLYRGGSSSVDVKCQMAKTQARLVLGIYPGSVCGMAWGTGNVRDSASFEVANLQGKGDGSLC